MITQTELKSKLHYDPETGLFTWLVTKNGCKIGGVAGSPNGDRYIRIMMNNKHYAAHRLAFLYMTGASPENQIDHINGTKDDNRWKNLREATNTQNKMNSKVYKSNKLSIKGVWARGNKFRAKIVVSGKRYNLGTFRTKEDASQAYEDFAKQSFGEFYHETV